MEGGRHSSTFEQYGEPSPWALEGSRIRDKRSSSVGVFELSLSCSVGAVLCVAASD